MIAKKLKIKLLKLFSVLIPFLDRIIKKKNCWAFSTHYIHTGRFTENSRAVFENVKTNPDIQKIIFYRGDSIEFEIDGAVNYEIVNLNSLRAIIKLLQCNVIFVNNSISMDFSLRFFDGSFALLKLCLDNRFVINLWHGIPLKKLLNTANESTSKHLDRFSYRRKERQGYSGLVASSEIDSYAMASSFYPLSYSKVWTTGLPRNDFLIQPKEKLPNYIYKACNFLECLKRGRKLIVYAPTYRQVIATGTAFYYQFSKDEIKELKNILIKNNAILGYRPHYFKNSEEYFNFSDFVDDELIFDLSQSVIHDFSAIAREMDILITDYSSVYMDALYLDKTIISFAYDLKSYKEEQDGLLYDMSLSFPGVICSEFSEMLKALNSSLRSEKIIDNSFSKKLFYSYLDDKNSKRLVDKVLAEITR